MPPITKPCPECGERLNKSARACACGWREAGVSTKAPTICRVECTARADGDDGLCGYHRALRNNEIERWRQSQRPWRAALFAEFRDRHAGDTWGALIAASSDLQSDEDRRDLLALLKKQVIAKPLPYNPRASADEINADLDREDEQDAASKTEALKQRAREAVERYMDRKREKAA